MSVKGCTVSAHDLTLVAHWAGAGTHPAQRHQAAYSWHLEIRAAGGASVPLLRGTSSIPALPHACGDAAFDSHTSLPQQPAACAASLPQAISRGVTAHPARSAPLRAQPSGAGMTAGATFGIELDVPGPRPPPRDIGINSPGACGLPSCTLMLSFISALTGRFASAAKKPRGVAMACTGGASSKCVQTAVETSRNRIAGRPRSTSAALSAAMRASRRSPWPRAQRSPSPRIVSQMACPRCLARSTSTRGMLCKQGTSPASSSPALNSQRASKADDSPSAHCAKRMDRPTACCGHAGRHRPQPSQATASKRNAVSPSIHAPRGHASTQARQDACGSHACTQRAASRMGSTSANTLKLRESGHHLFQVVVADSYSGGVGHAPPNPLAAITDMLGQGCRSS